MELSGELCAQLVTYGLPVTTGGLNGSNGWFYCGGGEKKKCLCPKSYHGRNASSHSY